MSKRKKPFSSFEKEVLNASFKEAFEKEYREFVLSELLLALMDGEETSVRKLAKSASLSPTSIQKMCAQEIKKISSFPISCELLERSATLLFLKRMVRAFP